MSIDYKQLQEMVKEAMFTGGGINEPSATEGVPHRMPSANTDSKAQDKGDPKANKMYDVALAAREAAEQLVEALDDPTFDGAYEYAFKASALLRKALNSLESSGAHPMPDQRVVSQPAYQQKPTTDSGASMGDFAGGPMIENLDDREVQAAIKAYEALDPSQVAFFEAYFAGDKKTDDEGSI